MDTCPCCSGVLLRHISHGSLYWFCRNCWAEMPSVEEYRARHTIGMPEPVKPLVKPPVKPYVLPQPQPSLVVCPREQSSLVQYRDMAA